MVQYLVPVDRRSCHGHHREPSPPELFPVIEKVNDDRAAIEITSKRGNAVPMSADEYAAWQETAYLFRSPANARRLLDAGEAAAEGQTVEHPLDQE
jgi:antitoxin YefM